ncbi:MAG: response regulator [Acidobacteriaceae bacterium]
MVESEKIRVVIVDDIAETRENIRKLLQFDPDVEVVGVARTGREAIDISKDVKPDVLLMDINMPDMDGIAATEIIRKTVPFTQIVILSIQNDPNYMRRAMLAGARDFLTKPPTIDELNAAIRRAGANAREERAKVPQVSAAQSAKAGLSHPLGFAGVGGKVITFYSPKGGSGCTTLATNLAVSLENEETSVVLVDGNLQFGDVAVFLNEQGKFSILDLTPRADELDPDIINNVTIKHSQSGVKILPAPMKPEQGDSVTGEQFSKVIRFLREVYSYVIIDTASLLTNITASAIDNSDLLILLTTQDIPSIKNCRLFLDELDALGFDRKHVIFVMNKFDKRIGITPEKVSENLKQEITAVIPYEERVIISVNRGIPFILVDKSRPLSRSVIALADHVKQRVTELESEPELMLSGKVIGRK